MDTREHIMFEGEEVTLHTKEDFEGMRAAGKLAAQTLDHVAPFVVEGASTEQINQICHDFIVQNGAIPAPLNYKGFPKSVCTSVNHVICHGIPNPHKILQKGDIVNVDVTAILDGWYGDTSRTFCIGKVSNLAKRLVDTAYNAMMEGINIVRPGVTLGDVGATIARIAQKERFSVVRDFCGHGIGRAFHMPPNVLHYGRAGTGLTLQEGMFFTIEPMINVGSPEVRILPDGWTAVTRDRSLSAQWEHTIGVTAAGAEIFTLS